MTTTLTTMAFTDAPTMGDDHVRLVQLGTEHTDDLAVAASVGELWRTWYTSIPSPDQIAENIGQRLTWQAEGTMAPWAILTPAGTAVGMTSFWNLDEPNRRLEIGHTWLGRQAQGTDINPAAKLLLLTRAFETLSCLAVEFRTHSHNHQSRAAITRLGAKQDGVLRKHMLMANGTVRDTVVFSITDDEWPAVRVSLRERLAARDRETQGP